MFKKDDLTDFEKLLFAEKYINMLKSDVKNISIENGKLKSELQELEFKFKQEKPENSKLNSYKKQLKATREQSKKFKRLYEKYFYKWIIIKDLNS